MTRSQRDPDLWRKPGGSIQANLTRWVRDDGAVFISDTLILAEVTTEGDDRTVMFQTCRPDPDFDVFVLGAEKLGDEHGTLGAQIVDGPTGHTFAAEFWSANVDSGAIVGYYHWALDKVSDVRWTGVHLCGTDAALMTYKGTRHTPLSYELTPFLPEYVHGVTEAA